MADTYEVDVQIGDSIVTRRLSAASEAEAQQQALAGKGLVINRQLLGSGLVPGQTLRVDIDKPQGAPAGLTPEQMNAYNAIIPPEARGTISQPPSAFDQAVRGA